MIDISTMSDSQINALRALVVQEAKKRRALKRAEVRRRRVEVLSCILNGTATAKELSVKYGVSPACISSDFHNTIWRATFHSNRLLYRMVGITYNTPLSTLKINKAALIEQYGLWCKDNPL